VAAAAHVSVAAVAAEVAVMAATLARQSAPSL
jgi:hypothetical protein